MKKYLLAFLLLFLNCLSTEKEDYIYNFDVRYITKNYDIKQFSFESYEDEAVKIMWSKIPEDEIIIYLKMLKNNETFLIIDIYKN